MPMGVAVGAPDPAPAAAVAVAPVAATVAASSETPFPLKVLLLHCIVVILTEFPGCRLLIVPAMFVVTADDDDDASKTGTAAFGLSEAAASGERARSPLSVRPGLGIGLASVLVDTICEKEATVAVAVTVVAASAGCRLGGLLRAQGTQNMAACSRSFVKWSNLYSCTHFSRLLRDNAFDRSPLGEGPAEAWDRAATWGRPSGRVAPHRMHTQHRSQLQRPVIDKKSYAWLLDTCTY